MKCYICGNNIGSNIMYIRKDIKNAYFCSTCANNGYHNTNYKQVVLSKEEMKEAEKNYFR